MRAGYMPAVGVAEFRDDMPEPQIAKADDVKIKIRNCGIYGSEVHVIADLSDIAADSGSYTVPARIEVSGYDVGAVGTYEVTVHIS